MQREEKVNYGALWAWARSSPRRIVCLLRINWRHRCAERRRRRRQRRIDGSIPSVLAVSPTMRCNYSCQACYSRGRPGDDELATAELDALFSQAEDLGIHSIVLTGGEPLLRDDILNLTARHHRLLFFLITNGSLVTPEIAAQVAKSGNVIPLVSLEGFAGHTDERRQPGAHSAAMRAFTYLRQARERSLASPPPTRLPTPLNWPPTSSSTRW